jgi:hypothetical protein
MSEVVAAGTFETVFGLQIFSESDVYVFDQPGTNKLTVDATGGGFTQISAPDPTNATDIRGLQENNLPIKLGQS